MFVSVNESEGIRSKDISLPIVLPEFRGLDRMSWELYVMRIAQHISCRVASFRGERQPERVGDHSNWLSLLAEKTAAYVLRRGRGYRSTPSTSGVGQTSNHWHYQCSKYWWCKSNDVCSFGCALEFLVDLLSLLISRPRCTRAKLISAHLQLQAVERIGSG